MKKVHLLACSMAFASMLGAQTGGLASVEGQVVSSSDGAAVRRAAVSLQRSFTGGIVQPGQPPRAQVSPQLQVDTDDQGRFAFRDLNAGGYRITVQRQGFVTQNGGMPMGGPNVQLWLGEGQQLTGYVVRATPQAVIAGRVLDEFGDPVMGAQVYAQRAVGGNGGRGSFNVGSVQTNDLGEYRIANLNAGDYLVAASNMNRNRVIAAGNQQTPSDKPQLVYATTYHPGTAVASEAAPIHVTDGVVTSGVDIKLAQIQAYSVHVTVADTGAPSNGAIAFPNLRPRDASAQLGGGYFGPQRQQDGSYLFTGVPPGFYELTAQRNANGTPGSVASGSMPVEVRDRNLEGIVLQVKPNADLQGAVRFEQPGECNVSNLSVNLRPPGPIGGPIYSPMRQPATVGEDLRFTLKSVPPGVYSVNLNGAIARCYVKSILYGGQLMPDDILTVTDSGSLDLVLAAYNFQLSVVVVDAAGNPVPRARIISMPKDGSANMGNTFSTSGPGGQITLGSLRPGTYDVYAFETPDSNMPYPQQNAEYLKPFAGRAKTVTVGQTGHSTVEVTAIPASETGVTPAPQPATGARGSLAGKVVNAVNGAAMAGVVVTLRGQFSTGGPPRGTPVVTDDQGRFAYPDLAPGSYSLSAAEQRFVGEGPGSLGLLNNQVIVGEGQQVAAYVLKLAPAGVIAGTLKDESGQPVLGARIQAFRYRTQMGERRLFAAGSTQTDDLGKYRLVNLAPGDYYITVEHGTPAISATAVRSDTYVDIPAVAPAAPIGSPTPGLESITGPLPSEAETDYVSMWYPNAAQPSGATPVKLAVGATVGNIDMTWRRAGVVRIRGKVVDTAGNPVSTPVLRLMPKGAQATLLAVGNVRSARDGTFELSGVPAGSYNLMAWPGAIGGGRGGGQVTGMMVTGGGIGSSNRIAVQSIEVKDTSIEGLTLTLNAGRTIRGTAKVEGGGQLPRPAFISLRSDQGVGGATINIGADGAFTVTNIFPVVYSVYTQNLPANCYIKSIRYGGKEVSATGFEFTGDGQLDVVFSNTAGILEGSVTGADGKPAGLAGVVVAPVTGPAPVHTGNADANGDFYFANLPPGDYRVVAWDASAPEASDPPEVLTPFVRYAKTVTLADGAHEKVQVTVAPPGR